MTDPLGKCLKCGINFADWPNTWCRDCVSASRGAWERTKQALAQHNAPMSYCVNCGIPMDATGNKEYCSLCIDLWNAVQRPYFQRLHREWTYGKAL